MNLPDDLVREILSKLPSLDSAARLSCVCKSWYEWIKEHQRRVFGGCLMVFHRKSFFWRSNEFQIIGHENIRPVNLPQGSRLKVVGECNGILCLQDEDHENSLHLYNPITREYRKLPLGSYYQVFGFGLNKRDHDYKIVRIHESSSQEKVTAEVYKLSTNRWSCGLELDFGFDRKLFGRDCVYVNGSCYNFYYRSPMDLYYRSPMDLYYRSPMSIGCFDFETDTFGHIKNGLPSEMQSLGVLHDSLALCSNILNDKGTHVWVMSEHDNMDSYWTKKFTLKLSVSIGWGVTWVHETHLFQLEPDGERVKLLTGQETEIGRTRMFKVNDKAYRSVVFKPTLVSLSSGIFL